MSLLSVYEAPAVPAPPPASAPIAAPLPPPASAPTIAPKAAPQTSEFEEAGTVDRQGIERQNQHGPALDMAGRLGLRHRSDRLCSLREHRGFVHRHRFGE
ncbi:MAG: hypothetical protein ABR953_10665 [Candidatus Acidiferrales bacterium]